MTRNTHPRHRNCRPVLASGADRRAFSLVELVIVIVIIGVIGAIAIPRMTRGANNAGASALKANLQVLRNAVELYRAEHDGNLPTVADFENQMLQYSNIAGDTFSTTPNTSTGVIYGPYLATIPELPVGDEKGSTTVAAASASGVAWIYDDTTGTITPNTGSATDQDGTAYSSY